MSYEETLRSVTLLADASIGIFTGPPGVPGSLSPNSGKQFRWLKVTGSNLVGLCSTGATENPIGVLQNKPQGVNDAATVGFNGISMVELGATVVAGASLKLDTSSRVITGTKGTDVIVAVALLGGAVGQLVPALIQAN